ncbi:MAG: NAD(P)H-binding protein [Firmicutes bacterium]|nr:NAD(P)H-binding protein [Bacillota bacterium]
MQKFGFIVHPLEIADIARKFPLAQRLPQHWLENLLRYGPPIKISHITGIKSPQGTEAEGWFVGCLLTPKQMLELPETAVLNKIVDACNKAEALGAQIVGLGAYTAVVGDAGVTVADQVDIAVTTGNSYTVATALQGIYYAADLMEVPLDKATAAVLGATGSIGQAVARMLARDIGQLTLAARSEKRLRNLAERIENAAGAVEVQTTTDIKLACQEADIVVAVTSALETIVEPEWLKPGAIICDVARPRNVSKRVAEVRSDVLVFEGGVVQVPGDVSFGFDFGFPAKTSYACMAETMILALEGRYESFTLGRDLSLGQVEEIAGLAEKHGFAVEGLRSFERALTAESILEIKENARKTKNLSARKGWEITDETRQ